MFGDNLERIVAAIEKNYEADEIFFTKPGRRFPSRTAIKGLITELRRVLFPGYFGPEMLSPSTSPSYFIGQTLIDIESVLREQLILALTYTSDDRDDLVGSGNHLCGGCTSDSICEQTADICTKFFDALPEIQRTLLTDVQALYDGDPAAGSKEEVIFTYPGLYAIYVYRIAHVLYDLGVPIIPRVMTEIAHSSTGIDIGAGAHIGEYFFIDHGTGVVIGETTTIGDHVKLMALKSLYPQGAEKMMVQSATGRRVPPGKLPADVGCIVMNVGSAAFVSRYLKSGKPFVSRSITVDGSAISEPKNYPPTHRHPDHGRDRLLRRIQNGCLQAPHGRTDDGHRPGG